MNIRTATSADAPIITDFNLRLARETEDLQLDLKTVSAGVEGLLRDRSKGLYFVAEIDGQLVGQLCITYEWSDWRNGNIWWIQSVYVRQGFRGRGVFSSLCGHLEKLAAQEKDVCGLRLYMEKDNERARRAYEKLGLRQTHYVLFEKMLR